MVIPLKQHQNPRFSNNGTEALAMKFNFDCLRLTYGRHRELYVMNFVLFLIVTMNGSKNFYRATRVLSQNHCF